MAKLIVVIPGQPEISHELTGNTITIGRLADNTIPIMDGSVSGHHARIVEVAGAYRVTDLDSMNKTWVRGVAVREAPLSGEVPIRFGSVQCTFVEGKTRVEKLEEQVATLKGEIVAKSGGVSKEAAEAAKKELDALTRQRDLARAERDDLAAKFDAECKKAADLMDQVSSAIENQKQVATILADTRKQLERALAERDSLRKESADMTAKLEAEKSARGDATGKIQAAEREQARISATLAETKQQLDQAVAERDTLLKESADLSAKLGAEKSAAGEAAGKIEASEKELARLSSELAETKRQLEKVASERDAARRAGEDFSKRLEEAEAQLKQAATERDTLRKERADLAAKLEAEKSAKGDATGKIQAVEKEQARLAATLSETKKQLDQAVAERDALRKERADLSTKLEAEMSAQHAVTGKVQATEKEQARLNGALAETKKQLEEAVAERDTLRKERADLATKLEAEKAAQAAAAGRAETTGKEQTRLADELAEAKKQLEKSATDLDAARRESAGLAAKLDAEKSAKGEALGKAQTTSAEHARLSSELAEARMQAAAVAAERDALRKEREKFSEQLKAVEAQLAATTTKHTESEQSLGGIEQELKTAKADLDNARAGLILLRKERDEIAERKLLDDQRVQALEEELRHARETSVSAAEQIAALKTALLTAQQEKQDLAARLDAELKQAPAAAARNEEQEKGGDDQLAFRLEEAQAQIVNLQAQNTELTTELSTATARHPEIGSILAGLPQVTAWLNRSTQKRGEPPSAAIARTDATTPPPEPIRSGAGGGGAREPKAAAPLSRQALHKAGLDGVAAMRGFIHHLVRHPDDVNLLHDFVGQARGLVERHSGLRDYEPLTRLAWLLDAFTSDLCQQPRRVETRMLRSLIQAVDTLALLLDGAARKKALNCVAMHALMLGCDEAESAPLTEALAGSGFSTAFTATLDAGFKALQDGPAEIICVDATRLGGNTAGLCGALKTNLLPGHPPVLLFTEASPVAEWARWSASGVSDFLMKPVHPLELSVKALSLVYRFVMSEK